MRFNPRKKSANAMGAQNQRPAGSKDSERIIPGKIPTISVQRSIYQRWHQDRIDREVGRSSKDQTVVWVNL